MAQLSDDCFAFGGKMMSVDEALTLISSRITPVGTSETVPLMQADGRILARDLIASIALPPFTNSASMATRPTCETHLWLRLAPAGIGPHRGR